MLEKWEKWEFPLILLDLVQVGRLGKVGKVGKVLKLRGFFFSSEVFYLWEPGGEDVPSTGVVGRHVAG